MHYKQILLEHIGTTIKCLIIIAMKFSMFNQSEKPLRAKKYTHSQMQFAILLRDRGCTFHSSIEVYKTVLISSLLQYSVHKGRVKSLAS
jgi:hypothetical protein